MANILFWIAALIVAIVTAQYAMRYVTRYYDGPVSDHYDGRRFYLSGTSGPPGGNTSRGRVPSSFSPFQLEAHRVRQLLVAARRHRGKPPE